MSTQTLPDVDIESLLDESIPCQGVDHCPHEIAWLMVHRCCGLRWLGCQHCHDVVVGLYDAECTACHSYNLVPAFFSRVIRL